MGMDLKGTILKILQEIIGSNVASDDLDLPLYEHQLIDSLGTVELIVRLSEELKLDISPADLDRDTWATPRLLIANLQHRLSVAQGSECPVR